jgi:cytochrome c oxidase accessory protein FixG
VVPRHPTGVAWFLILLFTVAPYLRSGDKPMFLLDIATRHFTLFGWTFLPTDTLPLALFMIAVFVGIFLMTALLGRVWCGWACPQTVYLEFVYRPIERLLEGAPGRKSGGLLRGSPAAKPVKFLAYLIVSMLLAHTFLAWFVGVDRLLLWVRGSPLDHPVGFMVMAATTGLMLFDFGYFREYTCIVACPYGRLQSVLLDQNSLIITYDRKRGEPRGKKSADAEVGDCVDCEMCVTTCPTGIDIRNGLQMECIGCAQCIDACDAVMTKLKRPRGLIRYSSQAAVEGASRRLLRPRVIIYPMILIAVLSGFFLALGSREPADVTVLRGLGRPFTEMTAGEISNPVRIKIVNRTEHPVTYLVSAVEPGVRVISETDPILIAGGKSATIAASIIAPGSAFDSGSKDMTLRISDGKAFTQDRKYKLLGPGTVRRESGEGAKPEHEERPR